MPILRLKSSLFRAQNMVQNIENVEKTMMSLSKIVLVASGSCERDSCFFGVLLLVLIQVLQWNAEGNDVFGAQSCQRFSLETINWGQMHSYGDCRCWIEYLSLRGNVRSIHRCDGGDVRLPRRTIWMFYDEGQPVDLPDSPSDSYEVPSD